MTKKKQGNLGITLTRSSPFIKHKILSTQNYLWNAITYFFFCLQHIRVNSYLKDDEKKTSIQ